LKGSKAASTQPLHPKNSKSANMSKEGSSPSGKNYPPPNLKPIIQSQQENIAYPTMNPCPKCGVPMSQGRGGSPSELYCEDCGFNDFRWFSRINRFLWHFGLVIVRFRAWPSHGPLGSEASDIIGYQLMTIKKFRKFLKR